MKYTYTYNNSNSSNWCKVDCNRGRESSAGYAISVTKSM